VPPAKAPTRRRRHAVESKLTADFFACPQHHVIP
jgi:hypothetical protein